MYLSRTLCLFIGKNNITENNIIHVYRHLLTITLTLQSSCISIIDLKKHTKSIWPSIQSHYFVDIKKYSEKIVCYSDNYKFTCASDCFCVI